MAEATYDLTQTGQQVQDILNDANKFRGAGSVTSITTDSIILKGTDGSYHKIDKSSFTEAVRNTLATLLVNNDKGTIISQVAAINQGDFGSITVANLASVLGAQAFKSNLTSSDDFNTIEEGIYNFSANSIPAHAPSGLSVSGVIECRFLTSNKNVRTQTITASNGNQYVRIRYSSANTWFDWKQIYP